MARDTRGLGARGRRARSMYGFDEDPVGAEAVTKEETDDHPVEHRRSLPVNGPERPVGPPDGVPETVVPSSTHGEEHAAPEVSSAGHPLTAAAPQAEGENLSETRKQSSVPVKQKKSVDIPGNPPWIETHANNLANSSSETVHSSDEDPFSENLATPERASDQRLTETPSKSELPDPDADPMELSSSAQPEAVTSHINRTNHTRHTNLTRLPRRTRQPNGSRQSSSTKESTSTRDHRKPDLPHDSGCELDPCTTEQDVNPVEEPADSATGDWRAALLQERPASTTHGVKAGWTRKTELFRIEHVSLLKAFAWWERRRVRDILEEALEHYWAQYTPETIQNIVREYSGTEHGSND